MNNVFEVTPLLELCYDLVLVILAFAFIGTHQRVAPVALVDTLDVATPDPWISDLDNEPEAPAPNYDVVFEIPNMERWLSKTPGEILYMETLLNRPTETQITSDKAVAKNDQDYPHYSITNHSQQQLKNAAKIYRIKGYTKMSKAQLVDALNLEASTTKG